MQGSIPIGRKSSLLHAIQTASEASPVSYITDFFAVLVGAKRQEREAGHSALSSTEAKITGAIPPLPP
jgi:hypothetical protein